MSQFHATIGTLNLEVAYSVDERRVSWSCVVYPADKNSNRWVAR
jgi:hypothetical protein